jgi:hypothetical protein
MFKKLLSLLSLLLSITLSIPALSQSGQSGQSEQKRGKGEKEQPSVAQKSKAVNESCDGALNIVPTKSMTFARKRRPPNSEAKKEPAPEKDRDSKPAERRPGDGR